MILKALEPELSEQVRHGLGTLMVQSYDPSKLHPSGRAPLLVEGLVGAQLDVLSSSRVKLTEAILLYEYIYLSDARKTVFGFQKSLINVLKDPNHTVVADAVPVEGKCVTGTSDWAYQQNFI